MGFGGIGPGSLILILLIVIVLFGTKKLRNMGGDIGGALRNFRKAMKEGDESTKSDDEGKPASQIDNKDDSVIDAEVVKEEKNKVE